jgi:ABC-type multidrug transport system ATPase subunit
MLFALKLSKKFGTKTIFENVSLTIARGDFAYLLGGTGSGKTTLLRILSTEESPTSGDIEWFGFPGTSLGQRQLKEIRHRVSVMPQSLELVPDFTVQKNIELAHFGLSASHKTDEATLRELLQTLKLTDRLNAVVRTLSGGEKQRVAFLRALARKADLYLLDEPTGAQDSEMTWKMLDAATRLQVLGASVVLATHDLEMVRRVRRRVLVFRNGTVEEGRAV